MMTVDSSELGLCYVKLLGIIFQKGVTSDVNKHLFPFTLVNVYIECERDEMIVYIQGYVCLKQG